MGGIMARLTGNQFTHKLWTRFILGLFILTVSLAGLSAGQAENGGPPQVGQGSLLYRSPISGVYQEVPLLHTDVALDVRGLVAAATVTQQYANSGTEPIEA